MSPPGGLLGGPPRNIVRRAVVHVVARTVIMSRAGGPGLSRFCDEPARMTSDNSPLDVVQMGQGRNLVLLHSLLSDRTAFDRIAARLAAERHIWLVNLPGFGASAPAGPGLEQMADRIAQQL